MGVELRTAAAANGPAALVISLGVTMGEASGLSARRELATADSAGVAAEQVARLLPAGIVL